MRKPRDSLPYRLFYQEVYNAFAPPRPSARFPLPFFVSNLEKTHYTFDMFKFDSSSAQGVLAACIKTHLENPSDTTRFVFSTSVVRSSWVDWACENVSEAVALERFTAWDEFKKEKLHLTEENGQTIPSLLRKIFIQNLMAKGKLSLPALIPPEVSDNPSQAVAFSDWLASVLPSLKRWHDKVEEAKKNSSFEMDDADRDYETLYQQYCRFLSGEGREGPVFYESAWIDTAKLKESLSAFDTDYIIVYPEVLDDWDVYKPFIEQSDHVKPLYLPPVNNMDPQMKNPAATFFTNARSELRSCAVKIRNLCKSGVPWNTVAVSVPDLEKWRPYIEREFTLYCIPHVVRSAEKLTVGAGRIFREIQTCVAENFSYESVRALLLDECVPWKDRERNMYLIRDAIEAKCICNYSPDGKDLWEKSLAASQTGNTSEAELRLYSSLKKSLTAMSRAKSFEDLYTRWFTFKADFFNADEFSEEDNLRISRCISVLDELRTLEKQLLEPLSLSCPDVFSFFLREIENTAYQPQVAKDGVSVFDYKVAAGSAYPYQFVLNLTQGDAAVSSGELSFLGTAKRKRLGLSLSSNASDAYIRLYGSDSHTCLSVSEQTFSGFAIPYSLLSVPSKPVSYALEEGDFVMELKRSLLNEEGTGALSEVSELQKEGFEKWKEAFGSDRADEAEYSVSELGKDAVLKKVHAKARWEGDSRAEEGIVTVSQSDLKEAVICMRKWLFNRVLSIEEETLDTDLLEVYDVGNINHKILEQFMMWCRLEKGGHLPLEKDGKLVFGGVLEDADGDGSDSAMADTSAADGSAPGDVLSRKVDVPDSSEEIYKKLVEFAQKAIEDPSMNFRSSLLVKEMLLGQKETFARVVFAFVRFLCDQKNFGGNTILAEEEYKSAKVALKDEPAFSYYGGFDLILSDSEDTDTVVDFKNTSGTMPAIKDCVADSCEKLTDFQMLIYAKLWNAEHGEGALKKAVFTAIKESEKREIRNSVNTKLTERNALFDACLSSLDAEVTLPFVKKVQEFDLRPNETTLAYRDCTGCSYRSICRTTYTIAGDRY